MAKPGNAVFPLFNSVTAAGREILILFKDAVNVVIPKYPGTQTVLI